MAKLAKILKTEMKGDMKALASLLQSKGRGKDTILAHITPEEAKRLKKAGGRGSRNPDTGLLEFSDAATPDVTATTDTSTSAPTTTGDLTPIEVTATPQYASLDYTPSFASAPTQAAGVDSAGIPQYIAAPSAPAVTGDNFGAQMTTGVANIPAMLASPEQGGVGAPTGDQTDQTAKPTDQQKSLWDRLTGKLTTDQLTRLGLAGAGGLMGAIQSRKAAQQNAAAQQEQQALATPYQTQGRALTQAAAAGQLSPASAQAYQAARAQMEQQASQRGGVGAEQMAAQLEGFRQQLLQQQYTYGLQVAQIGDQISLGAIRTGLQLDAQLQQASQGFYTSLAAIAAGLPLKTGG